MALLTGCAAFREGDLPEVRDWPPKADPERRRPSVSLTVKYESFLNGEKWVGPPAKDAEADDRKLRVGTTVFEQSALFSEVRGPNLPADLDVEVEWVSKGSGSVFLAGVSVCTLGAVPMVAHSELQARATFRSREGALLGAVEMGERVTEVGWALILPAGFFLSSPEQVYKEIEVTVYRATLVEALRRGYLDP